MRAAPNGTIVMLRERHTVAPDPLVAEVIAPVGSGSQRLRSARSWAMTETQRRSLKIHASDVGSNAAIGHAKS